MDKMPDVKYRLPGPHGGFFFKDDARLRQFFRPWLRWLPCWLLWKIATWAYFH